MIHTPQLDLKNDMFYIGINISYSKLFALEIDWEFEEVTGSIILRKIIPAILGVVIMIPQIEDVTLITGKEVVGSPTSWLSKNSIFNIQNVIENVVAVNISGDVIHFYRSNM